MIEGLHGITYVTDVASCVCGKAWPCPTLPRDWIPDTTPPRCECKVERHDPDRRYTLCQNVAVAEYDWPGSDVATKSCELHLTTAKAISNALGFRLTSRELPKRAAPGRRRITL